MMQSSDRTLATLAWLAAIRDAASFRRDFDDDRWRTAAAVICEQHRISFATLRRSEQGENVIVFVDDRLVVKLYAPYARHEYEREDAALRFARQDFPLPVPEIVGAGDLGTCAYLVLTRLSGHGSRETWAQVAHADKRDIMRRLGAAMRSWHDRPAPLAPALNRDWHNFIAHQARTSVERQRAHDANPAWLERLPAYIDERLALLPETFAPVLLHGDVHAGNLLLSGTGARPRITGLIDFGDSLCGFREYDFVAPGVLMAQGDRELQQALLLGYGYARGELDATLRARLMLLTVLYEHSDLRKYALRLGSDAVHLTLDELEQAIWRFADD